MVFGRPYESSVWHCRNVSIYFLLVIFTALCYASAVLAMDLCPSVCLSVTSRSSTKTDKSRITPITRHDSPGTLVFWRQRSPRNSTEVTPYSGTKCKWGGSKSATFYRAMLCIRGTSHGPVSVCVCVCPCLSQDFRQIYISKKATSFDKGYISKTVKDRRMVSIKVE